LPWQSTFLPPQLSLINEKAHRNLNLDYEKETAIEPAFVFGYEASHTLATCREASLPSKEHGQQQAKTAAKVLCLS
jgi:hypothetical protein